MLKPRHVPLVLGALARWVLRSKSGRWAAAVVAVVAVASSLVGGGLATRSGSWSGLPNQIAPKEGAITLTGAPGKAATCTVRGYTGMVSGEGWAFRGDANVAETSCEGKIEKNGRVSALLKLQIAYRGRIKGVGGDWEDTQGSCTCEGDITGSLAEGGEWKGKCTKDDAEWDTAFKWQLASD